MATELLRVETEFLQVPRRNHPAFGVDPDIGDGQAHVPDGTSGAGKSTLGRVIMGDPTYKVRRFSYL